MFTVIDRNRRKPSWVQTRRPSQGSALFCSADDRFERLSIRPGRRDLFAEEGLYVPVQRRELWELKSLEVYVYGTLEKNVQIFQNFLTSKNCFCYNPTQYLIEANRSFIILFNHLWFIHIVMYKPPTLSYQKVTIVLLFLCLI